MPLNEIQSFQVEDKDVGTRLDVFLASILPSMSRSRIKKIIEKGYVSVNNSRLSPAIKLKAGTIIYYTMPEPEENVILPKSIDLQIMYEDNDVLVINKPSGMIVHPGAGNHDNTLVNGLLHYCGNSLSGINGIKRPGIVHRLDKGTSGLLVIAKNDAAHQHLAQQFLDKSISRIYLAICWKIPNPLSNTININIGRSIYNRQKMQVTKNSGKIAITHYAVLEKLGHYCSLIKCKLESGRTHQIRVHFAHIGNSLLGDNKYGKTPRAISPELKHLNEQLIQKERVLLHAYKLKFIHPMTQKIIKIKTPPPEDFNEAHSFISSQ